MKTERKLLLPEAPPAIDRASADASGLRKRVAAAPEAVAGGNTLAVVVPPVQESRDGRTQLAKTPSPKSAVVVGVDGTCAAEKSPEGNFAPAVVVALLLILFIVGYAIQSDHSEALFQVSPSAAATNEQYDNEASARSLIQPNTPSPTLEYHLNSEPQISEILGSKTSGMMRRWTNDEGKVIEAVFQGWDGSDHILMKLSDGVIYRYPFEKLSPLSKQLARNNGTPQLLKWTNHFGKEIFAAFEGIGDDFVLLGTNGGLIHQYPLKDLSPESQKQALQIAAALEALR